MSDHDMNWYDSKYIILMKCCYRTYLPIHWIIDLDRDVSSYTYRYSLLGLQTTNKRNNFFHRHGRDKQTGLKG